MLSVIIPTLNEHGSLKKLFPKIEDALRALQGEAEIVVVDDMSTDGTVDYVEEIKNSMPFSVRSVVRSERGLATAVIRGFNEAMGDIICVIDADLSHPPSLIPKLYGEVLSGADIAIGSRRVKGGGVEEWPFYRRIFSYIPTLCALPISKSAKDPLSGFFCIKKEMLKDISYNVTGYKILLEILVKAPIVQVVEVPYIFQNRAVGASKLNLKIALQYYLHLANLYIYCLKRLIKP